MSFWVFFHPVLTGPHQRENVCWHPVSTTPASFSTERDDRDVGTHRFSFSRRASVRCSSSLSWQLMSTSRCAPRGESCSRAGLEWRRRYWSSSLSPPHRRQHTEPPAAQPHSTTDQAARPQHKARAALPTRSHQVHLSSAQCSSGYNINHLYGCFHNRKQLQLFRAYKWLSGHTIEYCSA